MAPESESKPKPSEGAEDSSEGDTREAGEQTTKPSSTSITKPTLTINRVIRDKGVLQFIGGIPPRPKPKP